MTDAAEHVPEQRGAVQELAADPASRKRFLSVMGGAGAASALAIFMAACGGDDEQATARSRTRWLTGPRSGDRPVRPDARAPGDGLLQRGDRLGRGQRHGARRGGDDDPRQRAGARGRARADRQEARRDAEAPEDQLRRRDRRRREDGARDRGHRGEPRRGGLSRPGGRIESKEVLAAALAIHSVEARHAAALNKVVGKSIVPDGAFAKPASMAEVLPKVKPFLA